MTRTSELTLWSSAAIYLTTIALLTGVLTGSMIVFFSVDGGMPRVLQYAMGTGAAIFYSGLILSVLMSLIETIRDLSDRKRRNREAIR